MYLAIVLLFLNLAEAQNDSLAFQLELGMPEVSLENPDGSLAYYEGLATNMKAIFPLYGNKTAGMNLTANIRYFDLENTTKTNVKESAQMIGPGLGIDINLYILNFGYSYYMMKARHQSIGLISNNLEYSFAHSGYYFGLIKSFKALGLGLIYTSYSGKISGVDIGQASDANFTEESLWFVLRYDFGVSTSNFLRGLVR